jgi:glycosyltransferase involved in cell wall biosynthesis
MISALAITFNEVQNIPVYLEQMSFADEIIIVDSCSTDGTSELAKSLGVQVVERPFDNFSNQRNHALSLAQHDWVVFFDLDERIDSKLIREIQELVSSKDTKIGYFVRRDYYFLNQKIRFSGFQTDQSVRLFRKSKCRYNGQLVHEEVEGKGDFGRLKNHIKHLSFNDLERYKAKLDQYSQLQAEALFAKGKRAYWYHFVLRPSFRFLTQYIIRLGLLDGKAGLTLASLHSQAVYKRYSFLKLMSSK